KEAPSRSRATRPRESPAATRRREALKTKRPTAAPQRRPRPRRRARRLLLPGSLRIAPPPGTGPDAQAPSVATHAEAACAACGVALEGPRLHSGDIVDVFRGHLRDAPATQVAVKLTRARWRGHPG